MAMTVNAASSTGLTIAISTIDKITDNWDSNNHARRRPSRLVKPGKGKRSTKGAHKNLNEYARAAQLKYVTVERATPASLSQTDREENMSKSGTPAEKPKNNIDTTRGCKKAWKDWRQPRRALDILWFNFGHWVGLQIIEINLESY